MFVASVVAELPHLSDVDPPFDARASGNAAACRRDLEAAGRTIGMGDDLIVGICLARAASLLTRNRRHFDRIPDLAVVEP